MKANKATCPDGHEYLVNHQSAECPHERLVDIMNKPDRLLRLSKNEIARVCGRFARLKERSKRPIGYSTLAEMASLASSKKTASIKDAEHQQKIAEIFNKLEVDCACPDKRGVPVKECPVCLEALKSRILGGK